MATFLALTNSVLARLNEVQLTSSNFSNARGIQVQAQNAVNESIRFINQREFNYPFNHSTKTETLTFRIVKDDNVNSGGTSLAILQYNEYIDRFVEQEDEIVSTTLAEDLDATETEIDVASSTGFDSAGTIFIENEQITYTV